MKGSDNMSFAGVYPVYNLKFKIGTNGRSSSEQQMKSIAELETFSPTIDGKIEEWNAMDQEGWSSALMTGKSLGLSLKGKRCVGDEGNDYVAGLAWKNGRDCDSKMEIEFPEGSKLIFNCVVNTTNVGGGDSTNVAPLEFEVKSHGKPIFTPSPNLESLSERNINKK